MFQVLYSCSLFNTQSKLMMWKATLGETKQGTERLSKLPKVTQLVSMGARVQIHAFTTCYVVSHFLCVYIVLELDCRQHKLRRSFVPPSKVFCTVVLK